MRRKELVMKFLAYACVGALSVSSLAGYGTFTAKADEGTVIETGEESDAPEEEVSDDIILDNEGSALIGEFNSGIDDYTYLGYVYLKGATNAYKYLELTYTGNLTGIRIQFGEAYVWFNKDQAEHFVTVDGSEIELNVTEPTTILIDLEASGVDLTGIEGAHIHSEAMATNGGFTISDAKLIKGEEVSDDIILDNEGSALIGEFNSGIDDYTYLGYVYLKGATNAYKYLELTYTGNLTGIRIQFGEAYVWFNKDQAEHFVTVDGSEIELNVTEPTTILIDLEASGVDLTGIEGAHIHSEAMATNGGFTISDAKLIKGEEEENPTDETPTEETPTDETPTIVPGNPDDILLNGTETGSSMVGKWTVSSSANQYKYLGFATLKDATADYKYLVLTYTGDISSVRFEFAMVTEEGTETAKTSPYWFNAEGQDNYFVTADESAIPLDGGTGTTIVVDLEKTGISLADYNSVHMHAGNGKSEDGSKFDAISFSIINARLSKSSVIKDTDKEEVTQTPTQAPAATEKPTQKPAATTTPAAETTTVASASATVKAPAKAKVKKAVKKKASKKAVITLKKQKKAVGYQVKISTTKKFKKKTTVTKVSKKVKVTFKKLKKNKKYYVKARAYVLNAKGKKVYGKWSKVKKVSSK